MSNISLRKALLESLFHGIENTKVLHPPLHFEDHSWPLFFLGEWFKVKHQDPQSKSLEGPRLRCDSRFSQGREWGAGQQALCDMAAGLLACHSSRIGVGNGKIQKAQLSEPGPRTHTSAKMCVPTPSNRPRAEIHKLVETQAHKSTWCSAAGYPAWASNSTVAFA